MPPKDLYGKEFSITATPKPAPLNHISDHINQLTDTLQPEILNSLRSAQTQSNKKLCLKTKTKHVKKLQELMNSQPKSTPKKATNISNYLRKTVVNLSDKNITEQQVNVLSKGLKFIPTTPLRNHDDFITNIEKGLQQLAPGGKIDYLRHQITDILAKASPQPPNLTAAEKQAIHHLRNDKEITIAPADKGKATVILNTPDFHSMVNKILHDPTTYRKIKKDPTAKLSRQHKASLKQLKEKYEISQQLYYKLATSNPQPPYARATIKIHKTPPKARLLVCSRDTVFYTTAQHLTEIPAPLGKTADSYISDSTDFCNKLLKITEADQILSYDVVDLFTSVPIEETLQILRQRISELETPLDTNLTTDSIIASPLPASPPLTSPGETTTMNKSTACPWAPLCPQYSQKST
ncbi:uncharacterized protein LOC124264206 [Haliotis rubra]|uniref:uncharacterized protein LOC124264206 n=1 Tax=Haliotis rubra TaxID=36100 RepID=UPI001EE5BCFF|nr:uncharacterized protein LOC124264206 [Haliotis rubra]